MSEDDFDRPLKPHGQVVSRGREGTAPRVGRFPLDLAGVAVPRLGRRRLRRPLDSLEPYEDATMIDRMFRASVLALCLTAAPAAFAKDAPPATSAPATSAPAASAPAPSAKAPSAGQAAARERQKTCGAEWRGLTDAQKVAQGPKWPQFWSKCNKRLKGNDKA